MTLQPSRRRLFGGKWGLKGLGIILASGGLLLAGTGPDTVDQVARGRGIFVREWVGGDGSRHGGDGLGPVFNDSSCVACHSLGGPGGAGPANKNAEILTAIPNGQGRFAFVSGTLVLGKSQLKDTDIAVNFLREGIVASSSNVPSTSAAGSAELVPVPPPTRAATKQAPPAKSKAEPKPAIPASQQAKADIERLAVKLHSSRAVEEPDAFVSIVGSLENVQKVGSLPHKPSIDHLAQLHPAFRTARSVTLHLFSTDPKYQAWRSRLLGANDPAGQALSAGTIVTAEDRKAFDMTSSRNRMASRSPGNRPQTQHGDFAVVLSRRNAPALFGSGLIDAIPAAAIEHAAKARYPESPEVNGRVSRLPDGSIGRFGWKAQTSTLKEFVMTACAVELGLEVPGHPQGQLPYAAERRAQKPGLDLDSAECDALLAFVQSLAPPRQRKASSAREADKLRMGKKRFEEAGCATCHMPKLGSVDDLYSDLLLHDMGDELADNGVYGNPSSGSEADPGEPVPANTVADGGAKNTTGAARAKRGATGREWRTPPLWGFRDTAPYLHDGRAANLEEAVALHGGQAARSAQKFFALTPEQRLEIEVFLKSLAAPDTLEVARAEPK
jgi:CxxC motif-containing protein (DUF1111 family)